MNIPLSVKGLVSKLGQTKKQGFTFVDVLAHLFTIGLFIMTLQTLFPSSAMCQSMGCRTPESMMLPLRF